MTIGIDISPLQGPHRMRGIGYTLINFINNIPATSRGQNTFIFYAYTDDSVQEVLDILQLEGMKYTVRPLELIQRSKVVLPGRLNLLAVGLNVLRSLIALDAGDPRIKDLGELDVFIQIDPDLGLPKTRHIKKVLMVHDLIPYILEWGYMWNYKTARLHSFSRKAALRCAARRRLYIHKMRLTCRQAAVVLANSNTTKSDIIKYLSTPESAITVTPLGVNPPNAANESTVPSVYYQKTSWGYSRRPLHMDSVNQFILFVGGADDRRKLEDLVTAFNHLKAKGTNLKLVLAGDTMQGPDNISTGSIRNALNSSSYLDDIIFLGFISDEERSWLYRNASAFVFPSRYEGFGLPVLEAMSYGCPVISYPNAATREVADEAAMYADSPLELEQAINNLVLNPKLRSHYSALGLEQSKKYSWQTTAKSILHVVQNS